MPVIIYGAGDNELSERIGSYDMVLGNAQVTVKTDKPVFNVIQLLTGIVEKKLIIEVIVKAIELLDEKKINITKLGNLSISYLPKISNISFNIAD